MIGIDRQRFRAEIVGAMGTELEARAEARETELHRVEGECRALKKAQANLDGMVERTKKEIIDDLGLEHTSTVVRSLSRMVETVKSQRMQAEAVSLHSGGRAVEARALVVAMEKKHRIMVAKCRVLEEAMSSGVEVDSVEGARPPRSLKEQRQAQAAEVVDEETGEVLSGADA